MLHGDIRVNDVVVGKWTAVRKTADLRDFNEYHCTLEYRNMKGYMEYAEWDLIGHFNGNGALTLAARVLREGIPQLKVKPLTTEELMASYLR